MSEENPIQLFVSHLFEPDDEYFRVFEYLESAPNFYYANVGAPEKPPRARDPVSLQETLRKQIDPSEAVLVLAKLHARAPSMIEFQAVYAKGQGKAVIVLEAFGAGEAVPAALKALADSVVGWNGRDLTDAIKLQARHEDTTRFDVVEFKMD